MTSEESYLKFRELSRASIEKLTKLAVIFRDIALKEEIALPREEVEQQLAIYKQQELAQRQLKAKAASREDQKLEEETELAVAR